MSETPSPENNLTVQPYQFDAPGMNVPINVAPAGKRPRFNTHVVRFPSLEELIERERLSKYETVEVNRNEDLIRADDDVANAKLFANVAQTCTGYLFEKTPADTQDPKAILAFKREKGAEIRETSKWLDKIPAGHQRAVLQALHAVNAVPEYNEEEEWTDLSNDDENLRITVEFGTKSQPDFTVVFIMRPPSDVEMSRYRRTVAEVRTVKGTRKGQQRIVTNIMAGVEAFDLLFEGVEGGRVGEQSTNDMKKAEVLPHISPIIKRVVAQAVMGRHDADSSD
jgi:hypothetical protein